MQLEEFFSYKNRLMKGICGDGKIARLITDDPDVRTPSHALAYTQVFPYEYIPETVDEGKTFICFDVDIDRVENKTFYMPVLYVWCFTHKSKFRLPGGGVRLDQLSSELDRLLNGSRIYGLGELNLRSVTRFSPILDYQGRVLVYTAKDFNRSPGRVQAVPANRRDGE